MSDISLRKERVGTTYVPAKPCHRGHSLRWISNRGCVECTAIWRASNPDYAKEYMSRPGKRRAASDKVRRYRERWQQKEAGRPRPDTCEVCGSSGKICWDHDHETEQFRGWICQDCNFILGIAKDDSSRLRKLADYLEE